MQKYNIDTHGTTFTLSLPLSANQVKLEIENGSVVKIEYHLPHKDKAKEQQYTIFIKNKQDEKSG